MYEGEDAIGGKVWDSDGPCVDDAEPGDLLLLIEGSFGLRGFSLGADLVLGVS